MESENDSNTFVMIGLVIIFMVIISLFLILKLKDLEQQLGQHIETFQASSQKNKCNEKVKELVNQ